MVLSRFGLARSIRTMLVVLGCMLCRAGSGIAQTPIGIEQAKLTAADAAVDDYFGSSVAVTNDGNMALVGAPYKDVGTHAQQGAAYVFTRSGTVWTQQAKLTNSDGAADDDFGSAVAFNSDGSTALIGAGGKFSGRGAAYIFVRNGTTWRSTAMPALPWSAPTPRGWATTPIKAWSTSIR